MTAFILALLLQQGMVLTTLQVTGQLTKCTEQRGCENNTTAWMHNVFVH